MKAPAIGISHENDLKGGGGEAFVSRRRCFARRNLEWL